MVVYRYTDMDDNIIKYVGIVWGKSTTLDGRVVAHKKDWWYPNHSWKIEYFEIDMDSRTDAEYLEAHLISLYKSDLYYNVAKSGWGISSFIPDVEDRWIEYGVFKSDIIEPPDSEKIRKLKQINAKLRLENKQIKKRARDIYKNKIDNLSKIGEETEYLQECYDSLKSKIDDMNRQIDNLQTVKNTLQNRTIPVVSSIEISDEYCLLVEDIIAIYRFCNKDDLVFTSSCYDKLGNLISECKIFKNGDEICYSLNSKQNSIKCERLYPKKEDDWMFKGTIDLARCMIMGGVYFEPSDNIAFSYLFEILKQCVETSSVLYYEFGTYDNKNKKLAEIENKYNKLTGNKYKKELMRDSD